MAHEIATTTTGRAAFISRKTAWHNLGQIVAGNGVITPDMVFSQDGGGLGYDVKLMQAMLADGTPVNGQFFRVRTDTGAVFGPSCSSDYVVANNESTMRPLLDALVSEGLAVIETAGVLRGGADAWVAVRFKGADFDKAGADDAGNDRTEYYGVLMSNHDGRAKFRVLYTPIRIVCANTQGFALRDRRTTIKSVKHTKNATSRIMAEALSLWGEAAGHAEEFNAIQELLKPRIMDRSEFTTAVLDVAAPLLDEKEAGISDRARKNRQTRNAEAESKRNILLDTWFNGTGMSGDPTAWDAFNAVTETLDHNSMWHTQHNGSEFLESLLPGGKLDQVKADVLHNLVTLSR